MAADTKDAMPLEFRIKTNRFVGESELEKPALVDKVMNEVGNDAYTITDGGNTRMHPDPRQHRTAKVNTNRRRVRG
jgi:hypothetical protein